MIRRTAILSILVVFALQSFGQVNKFGIPKVTNYPHIVTNGSEQNWAITQDHRGVIYVGNDDKGILEYDGNKWRNIYIPNNSKIRSLATADDGTVYVGAVAELGYLKPDMNGDLQYQSLIPENDTTFPVFGDIWKTYSNSDNIYFCSERHIIIYSTDTKTFSVVETYEHTLFCFFENEKLYCGAFLDGLVELREDTVVKSLGGSFYSRKNIFGLASYDSENLIIGTPQDGLTIYNIETGNVDSTFSSTETKQYIQNHYIYNLLKLPTNDFLVSTADGGMLVVSHKGELKEIISREEGLQDLTIYSSYVNPDISPYPPVWSALSLGIAKTDFNSPLKNFTTEDGYQGLILNISSLGDQLFIGTSTGLYSMKTIDGKSSFVPIDRMNFRVWKFQNFVLNTGEEVLLAITAEGIYQIHKNGKVVALDDKIRDKSDPEGSKFWGYTILQDPNNENRILLGRTTSINFLIYRNGVWYQEYSLEKVKGPVISLEIDNNGDLFFGTELNGIGKYNPKDTLTPPIYYGEESGLPVLTENSVLRIGDELVFGTQDGIYKYNEENDNFEEKSIYNQYLPEGTNWIYTLYKDQDGVIWISYENSKLGWLVSYLEPVADGFVAIQKPFYSLSNLSSTDAFFSDQSGSVWFPKSNLLYHFQKGVEMPESSYRALVRKVTLGSDSIIYNGAYPKKNESGGFDLGEFQDAELIPHIKHSENNIEFRWSAPYFDQEEAVEYSYYLDGFSSAWSDWEKVIYKDFTNLPNGTYNFRIKAKNIYRDESVEDSFTFIIKRPWYLTIVAFFVYLILAVLIVYVIIILYTRRLKNENIRLEGIIQERTAKIMKQKEELTDSIEYASRIQRALLPPDKILNKHDLDHFILFRPRDIVSGDFYWIGTNGGKLFIVAADCTGHGVPGAFMSMLGISFLDEIIIKSGISQTNEILDSLRQHVITSLRQTGKSMAESTKDGMDLAMISIDQESKAIQYSGAYNPLYSVRELNKEEKAILLKGGDLELDRGDLHNDTHILLQVKADQMPIGISEKDFDFSAKTIEDVKSSTLYLFSDGYVDQFGGPNGKKLMAKNFKKLLLEIQNLSMEKQGEKLDKLLVEWMGDISQIDDVLIIGVKLGK